MTQQQYDIVKCGECGAKNRIPSGRERTEARCGKCHRPLNLDRQAKDQTGEYKLRCTKCGAKNRVPAGKINGDAKCGKCGHGLKIEELFVPQPIMVTDGNFEEKVMKSPLPVLLFAWAPW